LTYETIESDTFEENASKWWKGSEQQSNFFGEQASVYLASTTTAKESRRTNKCGGPHYIVPSPMVHW
jgi:hypothetical protein